MKNIFPAFDSKKSIADNELDILKFWKDNQIFEKSVDRRNPKNEFVFFDGPPFATGSPHYGHILAGAIKDAIPRYKTMQGYRIERKWGWDCHGVPVEFQVEKEHRIGGKPGIEKMGVGKFNELCRSVVMRCADDWENTVDRMGRFVDFKNDYKTMDPDFMESVWWVFGELWKKGLIYEGEKVVSYSPKLGSPLSNFEANLNYKDIDDPAVTVKFELMDDGRDAINRVSTGKTYFLAWTTTPWTLPSNLALAVNPKLEYVNVRNDESGENYWMSEGVLEKYGVTSEGEYSEFWSEVARRKGKELIGKKYKPLFSFFEKQDNAFQVLSADYVSAEEGTGIVHQSPNFGEDDARICQEHKIAPLKPQPIDEHGYFNEEIPALNGKYFRNDTEVEGSTEDNVNKWVLDNLGTNLFQRNQIRHSYPHCWRTDCALMYRGIKTWFVDVQKIKKTMVEQNQNVNWVPEHLKDGRFGKMLADAPDWAISRNRFWGTPIPVWRCDGCGEIEVMASRAELEKKSGKKVDDLHKHFVDDLSWKCAKCADETEITFIRHGVTDNNQSGRFQGSQNIPLNEEGRKQAEDARAKLGNFDVVISAPLDRAIETAKILFPNTEIEVDERIREKNHGDFEGMTAEEIIAKYPEFKTKDDIRWGDAPNGESFVNDVRPRVESFLNDVKQKYAGKKVAVITHRATLCALHECLGLDPAQGKTMPNLFSFSATLKNNPSSPPCQGGTVSTEHKNEGYNFLPYNKKLVPFAREMRSNPTPGEAQMWKILQDSMFKEFKFTRQKPILNFIADFYCANKLLVIEVDGEIHKEQKEYDDIRTEDLSNHHIQVLRFKNKEILNTPERVKNKIIDFLLSPPDKGDLGGCSGEMKRIPEVLDCWFESGSMPYASQHYPFANPSSNSNESELAMKPVQTKKEWDQFHALVKTEIFDRFRPEVKYDPNHESFSQGTAFLFFEKDAPIATGRIEFDPQQKTRIFLWNFSVKSTLQGQGIGSQVLEKLEDWAFENGAREVVFNGNPSAVDFYLKNGYQKNYWKGDFSHDSNSIPLGKKLEIENRKLKISDFPSADFIAEGLDQTRGWFYTLHVLGCALFGKNIYKNVITNGIILAEDGQKMSKSKKNYPDPNLVFDKYGADAMRFYLLNAPVVRGENFKFSEHGVAEVLKQIILPLRSSYQFFSTYANIDNWQPTKVIAIRHGEADHNVKDVYSSGEISKQHHLTTTGKSQVGATAKILPSFDVLIASPLVRTQETAALLKKDTKFTGDILTDEQIREIDLGDLEGKKYEGREQWTTNPTVEKVPSVQKRMRAFFDKTVEKYQGQTVCMVSHGDPIRELEASLHGVTDIDGIFNVPMVMTGTSRTFFAPPTATTELDQWILSELQTMLSDYSQCFDAYDLEGALRLIPGFIDNLNNWYLRRSRRRFWANGMTEEKQSGYQTLHYVLLTLSKILAPVCPFFAEDIFKKLGGGESVHLEFFPLPLKDWKKESVEKKIRLSREIVSLAAGIRARAKIKLRQPLSKLQFVSTEKSELDMDILREESNVKEIEQLQSVEGIAQQIVRVDAKKVGPRLGKKVQEIIGKGKSGDFELQKNGDVKISDELLTAEEFSFGFVCEEGMDAEATPQTVVILNTEVTEKLRSEGVARELIRAIQELRKKKDFKISDRISIQYATDSKVLRTSFQEFETLISGETLAEEIIHGELSDPLEEMEIDGEKMILEVTVVE